MPMSERRKIKKVKEYQRQFYPGVDGSTFRRKKLMDPEKRLIKIRHIPDDGVVSLIGHRAAGGLYSSIHPPLDELMEKYDPIKELVVASPGAKEGDRMKYVQFVDSMKAPNAPWLRARTYFNRYRGVDTVIHAEKELLEMRERDVEEVLKPLVETEAYDTVRTALKSIDPEGHSHRLDEVENMFDVRKRSTLDFDSGHIVYNKNMEAETLDKPIQVGFPVDKQDLRGMNVMYRNDYNTYKGRTEINMFHDRICLLRILGGFKPDLINDR